MSNPFFFQSVKHHLGAAAGRIAGAIAAGEGGRDGLIEAILPLGASGMTDVYEGDLDVAAIEGEIATGYLEPRGLVDRASYLAHLESAGEIQRLGRYLVFGLSDGARFCLRGIDAEDGYVHIHPARHGPATFRARPNTLKTAILTHFLAGVTGRSPTDVAVVNEARQWIDLSPVAAIPASIAGVLERFGRALG